MTAAKKFCTFVGGVLSPLLANILLDDFDKELESRGHRFVRYADDFLVFTKTREAARRVYGAVGRYLTRKLKLVVNRQKSRICSTDGVEFVGFIFTGYGGQIRVSPKNIKKFKDRSRVSLATWTSGSVGAFARVAGNSGGNRGPRPVTC